MSCAVYSHAPRRFAPSMPRFDRVARVARFWVQHQNMTEFGAFPPNWQSINELVSSPNILYTYIYTYTYAYMHIYMYICFLLPIRCAMRSCIRTREAMPAQGLLGRAECCQEAVLVGLGANGARVGEHDCGKPCHRRCGT